MVSLGEQSIVYKQKPGLQINNYSKVNISVKPKQ